MSKWRDPKKINLIVIHSAATPNGKWFNTHTIDGWHKERGFSRAPGFMARMNPYLEAIGYHFIIYTNGAVATGRHLEETGAHVKGHNLYSIGVCLVGTDQFSPEQWESLRANISGLRKQFPNARVVGHRDLSPDLNGDGIIEESEWMKTCPGFDVATWLKGNMAPLKGHILEKWSAP